MTTWSTGSMYGQSDSAIAIPRISDRSKRPTDGLWHGGGGERFGRETNASRLSPWLAATAPETGIPLPQAAAINCADSASSSKPRSTVERTTSCFFAVELHEYPTDAVPNASTPAFNVSKPETLALKRTLQFCS